MARRKNLGSSAAVHTKKAEEAARDIEYAAARTVNKARNGQCTAATMAYADMQQAIGRYVAHTRESGGRGWEPDTAIREGAYAFNQHCVREGAELGRRHHRRRRH